MLQPLPSPHTICATLPEAVRWAAGRLGIEAPVKLVGEDSR
jgi:hypothetical protein